MSDKAERSNRPEATVGEATGLVPAAEVARLEAALAAAEEDATEKAGMLADLADVLFGDEQRAERHGYEGLVERAAALVLDLGRARDEVVKALADTGAAEKRRMEAERAAVEAKGDAHRLRLVVEAKERGLAAAGEALGKLQDKVRRAFAARRGEARTPESLTLSAVGDEWLALYGLDVPNGIAGIGPTPDEAVVAFARAVRASQGKAGEAEVLDEVRALAIPSAPPEAFEALERALAAIARSRHLDGGAAEPEGGDLVVDGKHYKVPCGQDVPAEAVAAALRAQGLDAYVNADGALTWRVANLPSRVEVVAESTREAVVPPAPKEG